MITRNEIWQSKMQQTTPGHRVPIQAEMVDIFEAYI